MFSRQLKQNAPCLRSGFSELGTEKPCGHGSPGSLVPWADIRVPHDHLDRIKRRVELFGGHLGKGGDDTLSHLDLAGVAGDPAVCSDDEKGIEIGQPLLSGSCFRLCYG